MSRPRLRVFTYICLPHILGGEVYDEVEQKCGRYTEEEHSAEKSQEYCIVLWIIQGENEDIKG